MKLLMVFLLLSLPAGAQTYEVAFSPNQGAVELIEKKIRSAETSIDVAAYSFTSGKIIKVLCNKKELKIRVVLDKSQRGSQWSRQAKSCGLSVRFNDKYAIMHNKFMIIDSRDIQTGSFNYTGRGDERNAENVLIINNAPFVNDYQKQFDKLFDQAK